MANQTANLKKRLVYQLGDAEENGLHPAASIRSNCARAIHLRKNRLTKCANSATLNASAGG
jgi:hypothetical protein